jgi:hypothetical protein
MVRGDPESDDGFIQDYVLRKKQHLFIYCRLCRTTFPVSFKPKSRRVRLRCLCGHEGPLGELDVFRSDKEAKEHAAFYQKIYRAAKDALIDAGLQMPPSGKYRQVEDVEADSGFTSVYSPSDESAIRDGYFEVDESEVTPAVIASTLADFDDRLEDAGDLVERHEVLTELLEWTYCRRYFDNDVRARFREACLEDMRIAKSVAKEAKRRKKAGDPVRVTFSSFKHLSLDFEDDGEYERALEVVLRAHKLGLKGYAERAVILRRRMEDDSL